MLYLLVLPSSVHADGCHRIRVVLSEASCGGARAGGLLSPGGAMVVSS